jgi:hypothetical protein
VDEVEAFLAEQPRLGKVIDLETQIWWDERWLGRAEISPKYLGQLDVRTSLKRRTDLRRRVPIRKVAAQWLTMCMSAAVE